MTYTPSPYPHMPNNVSPPSGLPAVGGVWVTYVASGSEGEDFQVPIGTTMPNATYDVIETPMGLAAIPAIDLPNGAGDRTTTTFRVLTNGPLTAGDKLRFLLAE